MSCDQRKEQGAEQMTENKMAIIKELREKTGYGLLTCKKYLRLCDYNIKKATEELERNSHKVWRD